MLKWLCVIAVTTVAIVSVAYLQHHAREKYQAQTQADCVASAISAEERHSCAMEALKRKDYAPWWNILLAWPEGITTWAIIATGFVIAWQSSETRKAAIAARDSVLIQEASYKQWLQLSDWSCDDVWEDEEAHLEVSFTLFNPSGYLVVLKGMGINFAPGLDEKYDLVANGTALSPKDSLRFTLHLPVGVERARTFRRALLGLQVTSVIEFTGVTDQFVTERITGLLKCQKNVKAVFESTMTLTVKKHNMSS